MRKYFDFNSTRPKSVFEGIDLDDEDIEDVRFEKTISDNNELFKQEQFRMMLNVLLQPVENDEHYEISRRLKGSYNKDGQKHYTAAYLYRYFNFPYIYVFDYCFETKDLVVTRVQNKKCDYIFKTTDIDVISNFSKYYNGINIYFGSIYCYFVVTDFNILVSNAITDAIHPCICAANDGAFIQEKIPHIFFKNFKGFNTNIEYFDLTAEVEESKFENINDCKKICQLLVNLGNFVQYSNDFTSIKYNPKSIIK